MLFPLLENSAQASEGHSSGSFASGVGPEFLLNDSDQLIPAGAPTSDHALGSPGSHNLTSGSGALHGPASTLVGSAGGLDINLVWDASVRSSFNWSSIEAVVISAASIYTQTFSNHAVINIAVGSGEVGGSSLGSNALGESESYGYITNYSTVGAALSAADGGLVKSGLLASNALTADTPPVSGEYFLTSAEAKALGLVSGSSTAIDGYIGLTAASGSLYFPSSGGTMGKTQYDAVGVAAHEISEVMGRIGMEGTSLGSYRDVYTPLDLFRYSSSGVRDLTPTAGYFSTNDGSTSFNAYNNPANGGDAADWASAISNNSNAYDAFDNPGVTTQVNAADLLEDAVLGYQLKSGLASTPFVA